MASILTGILCYFIFPFLALLAYFNVLTVRSEEPENGIKVFDGDGNPVGLSKAAGEKVQYSSNGVSAQLSSAWHGCEFLLVAFAGCEGDCTVTSSTFWNNSCSSQPPVFAPEEVSDSFFYI